MMPRLVGLVGQDDSVVCRAADILYERHGFVTASVLELVREALLELDPMVGADVSLRHLVDKFDWDGAERHRVHGPEVLRLESAMRDGVGSSFFGSGAWVRSIVDDAGDGDRVVITDVCTTSDAAAVVSRGGAVVRVVAGRHGSVPRVGRDGMWGRRCDVADDLITGVARFDGDVPVFSTELVAALTWGMRSVSDGSGSSSFLVARPTGDVPPFIPAQPMRGWGHVDPSHGLD